MKLKTNTLKGAETYDVTREDVIASQLIPDLDGINLKFMGKQWFKDDATGVAYHFIKENGILALKETRQSIASTKKALRATPKPKVEKPTTVGIKCIDCGAIRTVHVQDAFQVKRCVLCQVKHRNSKRAERLKAKRVAAKVTA
jgi:ribosomal protein S27E